MGNNGKKMTYADVVTRGPLPSEEAVVVLEEEVMDITYDEEGNA